MSPFIRFSRQEVTDVYSTPLMDLVYSAATVHRMYNDPTMVRTRPAFCAWGGVSKHVGWRHPRLAALLSCCHICSSPATQRACALSCSSPSTFKHPAFSLFVSALLVLRWTCWCVSTVGRYSCFQRAGQRLCLKNCSRQMPFIGLTPGCAWLDCAALCCAV
jgi:hypothetical protein